MSKCDKWFGGSMPICFISSTLCCVLEYLKKKKHTYMDFPGGAVDKNPPVNAGDTGSIPGPGRSHMLWSN